MAAEGGSAKDPFYVGFAISVYQNSGDEATNWGEFEKRRNWIGRSLIHNGDVCGDSLDFWNRYEEDIERAASLGSNCFRLSLEWGRLQPGGPGTAFDRAAVDRYHAILDTLKVKGMEPFVTLHHYVHPMWFENLGAFEKPGNIRMFTEYAVAAFQEFGPRIRFWATFNEPGVASFAGFIYGSFPPGKMARIRGYGKHLLNMLRAHTDAYAALKSLPGGADASIGIVHNWFWFEPKRACCTPPYVTWIANTLNKMWGNQVLLQYLKTGVYDYNPLPWGIGRVHYVNPGGPPGCDHFGLNYYSRGLFDWKLFPSHNPGEVMTDMPYALHAEGLITTCEAISTLGIPIYITETGCADAGDTVRPQMIQSYMAAVEETVRRGVDLRGVMYWTLIDNFEWAFGFKMRFGIYHWECNNDHKRTKRKSAALLAHWFEQLKEKAPKLRAAAGLDGGAVEGRAEKVAVAVS